jgi:hypothetical protein
VRRFELLLAGLLLVPLMGCMDLLPKRQPYQRPDGVAPRGVHLQQGEKDPAAGFAQVSAPGHQPNFQNPSAMRQFMPQEVDNRSAEELLNEDP